MPCGTLLSCVAMHDCFQPSLLQDDVSRGRALQHMATQPARFATISHVQAALTLGTRSCRCTPRSQARTSSATSWTISSTRPTASYAMSASLGRATSAPAALRPPRCATISAEACCVSPPPYHVCCAFCIACCVCSALYHSVWRGWHFACCLVCRVLSRACCTLHRISCLLLDRAALPVHAFRRLAHWASL